MEWITTTTILHDLRDFENQAAWKAFANRFRTPIVAFARKLGVPDADVEDLAQETLLAFADGYRRGNYDREKGRLGEWLFGIAYRQLQRMRQELARRDKQKAAVDDETSFWSKIPDEETATKSWNEEWAQIVLGQCLDQVPREFETNTVQAFELFALAKRPAVEVAEKLGMTRNAVFIAKHRVLTRLRELQEQYVRVT